ncbi:MAG: cytochrome C oxidase assembly protein [Pseudomonadota bacterium]
MPIRAEHELHSRRRGRNVGVGLMLAGFVVLILALTVVKVTQGSFELPAAGEVAQ